MRVRNDAFRGCQKTSALPHSKVAQQVGFKKKITSQNLECNLNYVKKARELTYFTLLSVLPTHWLFCVKCILFCVSFQIIVNTLRIRASMHEFFPSTTLLAFIFNFLKAVSESLRCIASCSGGIFKESVKAAAILKLRAFRVACGQAKLTLAWLEFCCLPFNVSGVQS